MRMERALSGKFGIAASAFALLVSCQSYNGGTSLILDLDAPIEFAEQCEDWDDWDKAGPVFPITHAAYGNTTYVGSCGIAALVVRTDEGAVLIDTGTAQFGSQLVSNLQRAGLDPSDIDFMLYSHEHHDHIGGFAQFQALSSARVISAPAARSVFETGEASPQDPQFGMHDAMMPVPVWRSVGDGETIELGGTRFTAIHTPGHTPGALTWYWRSGDEDGSQLIVYADSLSAVSSDEYRFSDHPEYVAEFRAGIARLAELDCDILLTPHPSASRMRQKLLDGDLTSGMDCAAYAADRLARLEERLARELAEGAGE